MTRIQILFFNFLIAALTVLASFGFPSGNGTVPQNGEALVGFHEDALSQAATGKAQLLLAIVLGLALAADCSELTILGYLMPAAELHLCIGEHRKGWLGNYNIKFGRSSILLKCVINIYYR